MAWCTRRMAGAALTVLRRGSRSPPGPPRQSPGHPASESPNWRSIMRRSTGTLFLAALVAFGCRGPEGLTGPQGSTGAQGSIGPQGPAGPQGPGRNVVSVSAYNPVSTTSTAMQPIPQMSLTFNLSSAAKVTATFSAEMYLSAVPSSGGNGLVVNLLVDGSPLLPAVSYTAFQYYGAYSFTWVDSLPAGQHTVSADWDLCASGGCSGLTAWIGGRQLVASW